MAETLPSRDRVLELLGSDDRAFHAKEIQTKLGVGEAGYAGLLRLLDDLAFNGVVAAKSGHKFKLASRPGGFTTSPRGELREGVMSIAPRGFGFVASIGSSGDDVFIPPESLKGAMHGDKVKIMLRSRGAKGADGEVVEILSRGTKRVAGVLRRRGRSAWLEPDDSRIRGPIVLPSDVDTVGPDGNSGKDGDAAVVSITRFPDNPNENPEGKLEAVLGKPGEIKVEVAKVLVREQIEEVHSEQAFNEASAYGETVPEEMLAGREDLTHLPLPTIDPEDARDHDDAVWVERRGAGYRAYIAIADVSAYVRPGTTIDAEAMQRGCSIYLPDRAIPMLPRPLSSNLCSLLPDVVRLCLCAEVDIDASGEITHRRLIRGFMKSRAKLTYGGVARALGLSDLPPRQPKADAMLDGLKVALELSRILRARRLERGAVDFDLPEPKIVLDDDGNPTDIQRRASDPGTRKAYQLIEELMLLANEVVAVWLSERQVPTIFRIHAPPDATKLLKFTKMCEALGIKFDADMATDPRRLSELLKSFADHPLANVLNMLLLRSMKQATYDPNNIGHFGLASKAYLHFTSPIRRYPDVVVHRSTHSVVANATISRSDEAKQEIAAAALAASIAERKAMEIEREVTDLYRAVFMRDKIGQRYEGTVTAIVGSGAFVVLDAPFVDVLVKLEDLGGDRYELDDEGLRAVAERSGDVVSLGDRMMVEIIDVAILRRTVYARRVQGDGKGGERPRMQGERGSFKGKKGAVDARSSERGRRSAAGGGGRGGERGGARGPKTKGAKSASSASGGGPKAQTKKQGRKQKPSKVGKPAKKKRR
jgi:ribonuclease R